MSFKKRLLCLASSTDIILVTNKICVMITKRGNEIVLIGKIVLRLPTIIF